MRVSGTKSKFLEFPHVRVNGTKEKFLQVSHVRVSGMKAKCFKSPRAWKWCEGEIFTNPTRAW